MSDFGERHQGPYNHNTPYNQQNSYYNNQAYPTYNYNNSYQGSSNFQRMDQLFVPQQHQPSKVSDLYGSARKDFIKKVYIILSCQIAFTVLMTGFSMASQSFFKFQIEHVGLFYVAMVGAIVIEIYVFCCQGGRTYPANLITTSLFTLCEAYIVSFICSATGKTSGNSVVFLAALMTLTVTVACTLYAIFTDKDFTTCGALLFGVAGIMLVLFIILLFTDSPFIHTLYCALGAFLASVYIIVDTQMIVGGKSVQLTVDEYYFGALLLYIDIITLFLYLLELFRGNQ